MKPATTIGTSATRAGLIARLAYAGVLSLATLSPYEFELDGAAIIRHVEQAFQIPYTPRYAVDAARNLALFAGWGALWVITSPARSRRATFTVPLLTGFLLGTAIESLQLALPERTTSVLDVLTNTIGSGLGALLIVIMVQIAVGLRARKSYVGVPAVTFLGAYLGAVLLEATFPLGLEPIPGLYGGPLRRAQASLQEFTIGSISAVSLTHVMLLLPLGAFAVATLREFGTPYVAALRRTVALAAALFILTELAHAPLGLPIHLGAILTYTVAVALGARATGRWLPAFSQRLRGAARPGVLLAAYGFVLALWMWRPFVPIVDVVSFAAQLAPDRLIPLHTLGTQVDLYSVADIGKSFFLYLPVGALLGVWPLRRRGPLVGALPGVYLAAVLELGQLFVRDRFFDATDILVQAAAVAIGWVIIRRAGYGVYGQVWSERNSVRAATDRA